MKKALAITLAVIILVAGGLGYRQHHLYENCKTQSHLAALIVYPDDPANPQNGARRATAEASMNKANCHPFGSNEAFDVGL